VKEIPTPVEIEPEVEVAAPAPEAPQPVTKPPVEKQPAEPFDVSIQKLNTNTLSLSIVAGLACVVVIFFVGKAVLEYISTSETVVTFTSTSYLTSATPNPVVITQTNSITDIPLQAGSLQGVDYIDTQLFTPDGNTIPPRTIFSALQFRVLPSFTQSLTDVRFAQINNSAPVIIFEFTDTETALGGFLAWEDTMAEDLKEMYLITQTTGVKFVDDRINNRDVRVLTTATGKVLVVYGIASPNTAIITNSISTFTEVLNASFED